MGKQKITCAKKVAIVIPSICVLLGAALIIISLFILPSFLKSSIQEQLKMVPDTYQYWGQSPGKTKSITQRNFTFFNFTNPRQFLYQNQTPTFQAIHGYLLQERFNFTDYNYTEDKSQIYFYDWLYFTQMQHSRDIDEKLNVINVAPLGFWFQIDKVGLPTFALQGFGGLFVQLNQTFKLQAIGQGVSSQFLPNFTNWKLVCNNLQISELQCNNSWFDPQNGLSDQNNFQTWIYASFMKNSQSQDYLKQYFGFTDLQMESLKSTFDEWANSLNQILNNWFCNGQQCSSYQLTLLQLSSGGVTANPPSGTAVDSICDTGNITCIGQPQISKFLKNQFKNMHPQQKYQTLKFSTNTFKHLFTPYKGTLLNIGNLTRLFQSGQSFDQEKDQVKKNVYLNQIKNQTNAQTNDHAFVIWQWVKYFTSQFVLKLSKGGSFKNSGIGGVFAPAFFEAFSDFGNWVLNQYLDILGKQTIQSCQSFVRQTIQNISQTKIDSICADLKQKDSGFSKLFNPCLSTPTVKQSFRTKHNISMKQFAQYCDSSQKSFLTVALQLHKKIFQHYSCSQNKGLKICSSYELSLKQFINSSITLNPIQNSIKHYQPSLTGKKWNSDKLQEFEYKNYLKQFYGNQNIDQQTFSISELIDLASFDKLFSASMVMQLMLENDKNNFKKLYYFENMTLLKNFVKFLMVQVGFGGFVQKRSPRQLLLGYQDPFLSTLQKTDPMLGGDPSINPIVMLNQPNITEEEAYLFPQSVYSGYSDIQKTRQFTTLYNYSYITYNKTWYDGYQIKSQFTSPYRSQVKINGTDSIQNPPGLDESSSIYCLITNIYRAAKLDFTEHTSMYDVDLLKFTVDQSFLASQEFSPANSVYYQTYQGFHNISFLGVPLHISKNNMLSCPKNWTELIKVWDQHKQYQIKPSMQDDTVLKVQPHTGALFYASVRLQTNYHYQNDILFSPSTRFLPVNNVIRQGQIGQDTVDELFGDLKFAIKIKPILLIVGIVLIVLSLGLIGFVCFKIKKSRDQNRQSSQSDRLLVNKQSVSSHNSSVNINRTIVGTIKQ